MGEATRTRALLTVGLFAALTIAGVAPVRSYDLFWHLATGRWIVEQRALPQSDPFALASERGEWINGEWLFQVVARGLESIGGIPGLSVARAVLAALVFTMAFLFARRESNDDGTSLLLTVVAFAGAAPTVDFRPSSAAMLFAVLLLATRSTAAVAVISLLWMNVHPSALLAPAIVFAREAGEWWEERGRITGRLVPPAAAAAALLVTPHGLKGIVAPLQLMSWVGSGTFVNAEWLPSPPRLYPVLYLCVLAGIAAFATAEHRRAHLWRMALFVVFAWLAVRHVRNQPLFFAAFPLLVAPAVRGGWIRRTVSITASAVAIALIAVTSDHRLGVAPERFPLRAVERLRESGLAGNIYNPDQFGGFLIWKLGPPRRVLTDGRNELYRHFIPEVARARQDERVWRALLRHYRIDLAVEEYREPLPVIDSSNGKRSLMPASLAYWPRNEWALIAYDDAAMVFARRGAYPEEVIARWELRGIVPDAPVSSPSRGR